MQNTKKYWLRGGIWGIIIWIFLIFIQTFTFKLNFGIVVAQNWWNYALWSMGIDRIGGGSLESWVLIPLAYLFAGIFLGWLYGKIKNRNKVEAVL